MEGNDEHRRPFCLSAPGDLGYAITIAAGLAGTTEQDPLGSAVEVTFSPGSDDSSTTPSLA